MLTVIAIAGAAALTVIAYDQLRKNADDGGTASLKTARDLAAVVLVCVKAVEGIVEVLGGTKRPLAARSYSGFPDNFGPHYDFGSEDL